MSLIYSPVLKKTQIVVWMHYRTESSHDLFVWLVVAFLVLRENCTFRTTFSTISWMSHLNFKHLVFQAIEELGYHLYSIYWMLLKNRSLISYFDMVLLIKDLFGQFRNTQINVSSICDMGTISNSLWKIYAELLYVVLPLINFYQLEQKLLPNASCVWTSNFISLLLS